MREARNGASGRFRREGCRGEREGQGGVLDGRDEASRAEEDTVPDDRLRLIFTCCHPALALQSQVALTLRLLGGLSTTEIARAFLVPAPTMAPPLRPADGHSPAARLPHRIPRAAALPDRP